MIYHEKPPPWKKAGPINLNRIPLPRPAAAREINNRAVHRKVPTRPASLRAAGQGQELQDRRPTAGNGAVPLFPHHFLRAGHRGHHRGQEGPDAGFQQLPGPDQPSQDQGGRPGGGGEIRHRLRRLAVPERHAGHPPGAGSGPGQAGQQGGRAALQHRFPGQPRRHQRAGRQGGIRAGRQEQPRQHRRGLPALARASSCALRTRTWPPWKAASRSSNPRPAN